MDCRVKPGNDGRRQRIPARLGPSERDLVVELLVEGARLVARARKRARTPEIAVALVALAHAVALAVEHGEFAAILLQHDFGRVAVLAGLVLPFARLKLPLDVNLRALLQILLSNAGEVLVEDDHAVPLGLFAPLAGRLVAPVLAGGYPQIDDRPPIVGLADFGVGPGIAVENDLVDRSGHGMRPPRGAWLGLSPLNLAPSWRGLPHAREPVHRPRAQGVCTRFVLPLSSVALTPHPAHAILRL